MNSQFNPSMRKSRMRFIVTCLAVSAALLPIAATAKEAGTCTAGTTLRLSAPQTSQGSLLLFDIKSTKPLAEVQGDWEGRSVPIWQEAAGEKQRKGLLAVDLEKAPGEYELKITGQTADGGKVSCSAMVAVKKGLFATEKLQVEKQFVEPNPEQIKRANEERQKLRDIFDHVTPERLWDGEFRVPLDGVTTGSNFGKRRILNGNPGSPHTGVDFPAVTGTPVYAAQRGRVALAEELFFAGNAVVLDHGLGIYTFYGHLSEIDVKVGDDLEAGAVLGKVGATGRVTGAHLHWGLTVERARVNPLLLVKLLNRVPQPGSAPGQEGQFGRSPRGRGTRQKDYVPPNP
jgi:murein DD-endopeptidase MepM/ murein hydrolase activator NlpD